jgi:hypothetical protein
MRRNPSGAITTKLWTRKTSRAPGRIRWVFGKGRGVGSCNEDQNCRPLLPCHFKQQTPGASKLALLSRLALPVRTAAGDRAVLAILNAFHNPIGPLYIRSWQFGRRCPAVRFPQMREEQYELITSRSGLIDLRGLSFSRVVSGSDRDSPIPIRGYRQGDPWGRFIRP